MKRTKPEIYRDEHLTVLNEAPWTNFLNRPRVARSLNAVKDVPTMTKNVVFGKDKIIDRIADQPILDAKTGVMSRNLGKKAIHTPGLVGYAKSYFTGDDGTIIPSNYKMRSALLKDPLLTKKGLLKKVALPIAATAALANPIDTVTNTAEFVTQDAPQFLSNLYRSGVDLGSAAATGADALNKGATVALDNAEKAAGAIGNGGSAANDYYNSAKENLKSAGRAILDKGNQAVDAVSNLPTSNKVALGVAGVSGIALAGAIMADILKKQEWMSAGCDEIEDPMKAKKCKIHVATKTISNLKNSLSRCKYANNIKDCQRNLISEIDDQEAILEDLMNS